MQTIIEVKNLTHVYTDSENKEIKALDGINLEIRQGEFVAVIGANGSGKSTLARHFNALQRPSEGVCLIEWASLVEEIIPETAIEIRIEKDLEKGFDYRKITVEER